MILVNENCKNGEVMCDNIDSDDDGDEQSESSEGGAVNNEMENNEISGCGKGDSDEDEHDCSDGGASSIEDITDDNECIKVYSDDSEEVDEENND